MRHVEFVSVILISFVCAHASANTRVIFVPPMVVDEGASLESTQAAILRVQQALSRMPRFNLVARDGRPGANRELIAHVQDMLQSGEKSYLGFEHAHAAEALNRAAEALEPIVEKLDSADMRILARARFLEGTAWAEAHHPETAMDAFESLLEIIPDQPMDDAMLPPKVQPLWRAAEARVQAHSTVRVIVRAEPRGADVSLDGRWRGRAPMTLAEVPRGGHRLSVSAPGYATTTEQISVEDSALTRDFKLVQTHGPDAWRDLSKAAASTDPAPWNAALKSLYSRYDADMAIMAGVKRAANGDTWLVLERWQGLTRAGIVVLTVPNDKVDVVPDAMEALLGHNASPVYMPRPKAPTLDFDAAIFGVSPDAEHMELPAAESSLSVWGSAGAALPPGFGAAFGVGLGGTIAIDDAWSFDLMGEVSRSTQSSTVRADEVRGRLMVRRGLRWRRMAVSGGLHVGAAGLFEYGAQGAGTSANDVVPDAGLLARFDFDIGDWFLISVMGLAQVEALGITSGHDIVNGITYTVTYDGMLGLGGRF